MPSALAQFGLQLANQVAGAGMGLWLQKQQDRRQLEQQDKLLYQQAGYDQRMTEFNRMQQMKLWEDTNYKAQMEQLRKAGLNPGLIYGMSGGGGQSTNLAQGHVGSNSAPAGGNEIMGMMGIAMQNQMMQAQIENIKADTKKKEAEIPNIETQTASLAQGIQNQKAVEALTWVENEIKQVEASVSRQTINEQMKAWENIAEEGTERIKALKWQNELSEAQFGDKVRDLKQQIAERSVRMALMNAQRDNTNQDTKNKIQEILESQERMKTMAGQLMLNWERLGRESGKIIYDQTMDGKENNDWDFIKDQVPTFLIPIGKGFGKPAYVPIQGFRK